MQIETKERHPVNLQMFRTVCGEVPSALNTPTGLSLSGRHAADEDAYLHVQDCKRC